VNVLVDARATEPLLDDVGEVPAAPILHDHERHAVDLLDAVDARDVLVLDARAGAGFALGRPYCARLRTVWLRSTSPHPLLATRVRETSG
jgi:hypothetical protein